MTSNVWPQCDELSKSDFVSRISLSVPVRVTRKNAEYILRPNIPIFLKYLHFAMF